MARPAHLRTAAPSGRTGVSPGLLGDWEQWYGLLQPIRSDGGYRLYPASDEERVRAMRKHLSAGVSAPEAARLPLSETGTEDDRAAERPGPAGGRPACCAPPTRRAGAHAALALTPGRRVSRAIP